MFKSCCNRLSSFYKYYIITFIESQLFHFLLPKTQLAHNLIVSRIGNQTHFLISLCRKTSILSINCLGILLINEEVIEISLRTRHGIIGTKCITRSLSLFHKIYFLSDFL
nr:MAG TPA: hypothetical protein [Caudoviricetes sp.]